MKESLDSKKGSQRKGASGQASRSWFVSLRWAAVVVGIAVALSAVLNPLIGRTVHWDWMAGLSPTLLIVLTIAIRRRWV